MSVNIDVSEETLKEVLKAAGVAIATLGVKYLYRGIKFLYGSYREKKDVEIITTWGKRFREQVAVATVTAIVFVLLEKILL